MKRFIACFFIAVLCGCAATSENSYDCPQISIPRESAKIFQNDGTADKFQIILAGYEGYCYTEPADNRRYSMITPIFKVRRLEASSVTAIDVDFYVKTSVNAENYLGIRKFSQTLNIPQSAKEITIKGRPTKTRISNPPYKIFSIELGLALTEAEKAKAKKMLDINYEYLPKEEVEDTAIETIYLEIAPDEEIIYSKTDSKPLVAKKNRKKSNCCD